MPRKTSSKTARICLTCTESEFELVHWYSDTIDRSVAQLLRVFSLEELLMISAELRDQHPGVLTRPDQLRILARETERLAEASERFVTVPS